MRRGRRLSSKIISTDLMSNMLLGFLALFVLAIVRMNVQKAKQDEESLKTEGEFVVVIRWPDDSNDDVDLHVMDPSHRIAYFASRDVGLMHLEHDDQGSTGDTVDTGTESVSVAKNEERLILRGIVPGEYVVNVHMYGKRDPRPTPVTAILYRLAGTDAEIVRRERVLAANGDEQTAFRFTLKKDKTVSDIDAELQRRFVGGAGVGGNQGGSGEGGHGP